MPWIINCVNARDTRCLSELPLHLRTYGYFLSYNIISSQKAKRDP